MTLSPLNIGSYKIEEFNQDKKSITFWFIRIDEFGLDRQKDVPKIQGILEELGKWENAVISCKFMLSELGLITDQPQNLVPFEAGYGSEIYEISSSRENLGDGYSVRMSLKPEERRRRDHLGLNNIIQLQEVYDQLKNIQKWIIFQRVLKNISIKF